MHRTSEEQEKSEPALQDHIQRNRKFTESVTRHASVRADADIPIVYLEETRDRSDAEGTPEKQLQASQLRREEISARRMPEDTVSARHTPQDTVSVQTTAQGAKAVHRTSGRTGEKRVCTAGSYTEKQGVYRVGDEACGFDVSSERRDWKERRRCIPEI